MLLYTIKRLGLAVAIVLVAMAILFSMVHLVPGDPASIALGPRATPEMVQSFRERMGLDRPVPVQFARFVSHAVAGDLGEDVWSRASVAGMVLRELPHTVALTLSGLGWAVLIPLHPSPGCYRPYGRGGLRLGTRRREWTGYYVPSWSLAGFRKRFRHAAAVAVVTVVVPRGGQYSRAADSADTWSLRQQPAPLPNGCSVHHDSRMSIHG